MKKIEFNLDYYKSHHPMIETRKGDKARVICTDCKMKNRPVVALIDTSDETTEYKYEYPLVFRENGRYLSTMECDDDLFMLVHE